MTIWIFLWALISVTLIFFSVWTLYVLMMQKKAWRDFAKKYKLRYKNTAFMNSPQVNGMYKGYAVGIFSSEHEADRGANTRKMTAIEVELNSRMPIGGALGNGGMVSIVQALGYSEEFQPAYKFWSTDYICRAEDRGVVEAYLTEERAKALVSLMRMKNIWVIFIFKGNDTLLRIDTPEPFEKLDKLNKIIDSMIDVVKIMELKELEGRDLANMKNRRNTGTPVVAVKEEDIAYTGLELEDDHEPRTYAPEEIALVDGPADEAGDIVVNDDKPETPQP